MIRLSGLSGLVLLVAAPTLFAVSPGTGAVKIDPSGEARAGVAELFRLPAHTFDYKLALRHDLRHSGIKVYDLTFPSCVKTDIAENNTVYAELFMPSGPGPFPAAIVLDILQGDALIARGQAMWLAQHDVAGLVVYMAHYGPRRPVGSPVRLLSTDIPKTIAAVRQTVLDVRCAAAWLANQPDFDREKLGLVGTSLGSLVGAIAAANEPLIKNVCLILGGGGLVDAYYDHPMAKQYHPLVELLGGKAAVKKLIDPIDPLTYAKQLKEKNMLMIVATRDDIVPTSAGKALWEATGKQKIVWLDSTHVGAALHLLTVLSEMKTHLGGK